MKIPIEATGKDNKEISIEYGYLTDCTGKHINVTYELDQLAGKDFDIIDLYKIALWKTNRFPIIPNDVLDAMNKLRRFDTQDVMSDDWKIETKRVMEMLLDKEKVCGVGLPMASAFLRFLNPNAYQIIDTRAYRAAFNYNEDIHDYKNAKANVCADIYIDYINQLITLSRGDYYGLKVKFQDMDRFLYIIDQDAKIDLEDTWKKNSEKTKEKVRQVIEGHKEKFQQVLKK